MNTVWAEPQFRGMLAALLCLLAVVLAWPPAPQARPLTWLDLISPLAPGERIGEAFVLSPPRRGEEHDVVFMARRQGGDAVVELHVVPKGQWDDARQTASFGVSHEEPRSTASPRETAALVAALTDAIAANDPGGLDGDLIPLLRQQTPPPLSRALRQITGARGYMWALCLVLAGALLVSLPRGALWLALAAFTLGCVMRTPHLDLPFLWDQDVQRLQIGASDISSIVTDVGLHDRHPPLYFIVLHITQWFGQAEAVVRLPAAIFGALAAPVLVYAVWRVRGEVTAATSSMAMLAALSPVLIRHAREVSEITLFAALLMLLAGEAVRLAQKGGRTRNQLFLAVLCAAALWTYYLAGFAILAGALTLAWTCRPARRRWLWLVAGVIAGVPALVLGYHALLADRLARGVAAAQPDVAWGARDASTVARGVLAVLDSAMGAGLIWLFVAAAAWALVRRDALAAVCGAMAVAMAAAVVALSPVARIQPYYAVAAVPLMLLSLASLSAPSRGYQRFVVPALVAALSVLFIGSTSASITSAYVAERGAFMEVFAQEVHRRGDARVATVAHYDATLLSYYLARQQGVTLRADRIKREEDVMRVERLSQSIVPLVQTHAPNQDPDWLALVALRQLTLQQPILVVYRDAIRLPQLEPFLARCELARDAAVAQLLRCRHQDLVPR